MLEKIQSGVYVSNSQAQILTSKKSHHQKQDDSQKKNDLYADILRCVFSYFVPKDVIFDKLTLLPLINSSKICKLWLQIANECFPENYKRLLKNNKELSVFSWWGRWQGVLNNWEQQTRKCTYLLTNQSIGEKFSPLDCHLPLDVPEISYDKIKINQVTILLAARTLIARIVKINKVKKEEFETIWTKKMVNPEKQLFVSTDQTLLATQHYSHWIQKESQATQVRCHFDVYVVQTGHLIGQVFIHCRAGERFDSSNIQFDLTKFMYQREGKVWTRHYDPYLSGGKLS